MTNVVLQQPELDPFTQAATKAELDRGIDKTTSFPVDGKAAHGSACRSSSNGHSSNCNSSSSGTSSSVNDSGRISPTVVAAQRAVAAMAAAAALTHWSEHVLAACACGVAHRHAWQP